MSATALKTAPIPAAHQQSPVFYHPSCQSLLTDNVRVAVDGLIQMLRRGAAQQNVPVLETDVRGFSDPEEDSHHVVVRQSVNLPPSAALRYWESLGPAYESWMRAFTHSSMPNMTDQIAFEIRWTKDESAF